MKLSRKYVSAAHPETVEGLQYHVRCRRGDVSRYVLLPGDPERVPIIAKYWREAHEVSYHREFRLWTGKVDDISISACSTGIGGPSTAICVEELARVGSDTFIRVGSTGAIEPEIRCGDLVISLGAVRLDGASKQYVRAEYPALSSYEVLLALIEASERLGVRYHVGITASTDSFYTGQGRRGFMNYEQSWMGGLIPDLRKARVINFEMECSTLFTLASLFGLRAGCVCAVYANRITDEFEVKGEEDCARVAVEAVKIIKRWDDDKEGKGRRCWYPSLTYLK